MGLFGNNGENREQEKKPVNPQNMLMIRLLAVGYLLYTVYSMVKLYIAGGEDAPSLGLLIAAVVLFVIGSVWIAVVSVKQFKRMKAEQQAAWEEEERQETEEALPEGEEDYEDEFDDAEEEKEKEE